MNTQTIPDRVPTLIAHRGYALRYPENSLEAMEAALKAGALFVEFDVHLSADEEPMVIHDAKLMRTAGIEGEVFDLSAEELGKLEVNESDRLGDAFTEVQLPTLKQMVKLLETWPRAKAFIELKRTSLKRFGVEPMVTRVLEVLKPITERCIIISFNEEAVAEAHTQGAAAVGWILHTWGEETYCTATELAPDYLFCDQKLIPAEAELWEGPWQWVLYEITDTELALQWAARGAEFIETMAIAELLDDPRLRSEGQA